MDQCRKYESVFIRTLEYLNGRDTALVTMFLETEEVPIYYQYCQEKRALDVLPEINRIGYANNFRINNETKSIIADVFINPLNSHSYNWIGEIDNFTTRIVESDNTLKFGLVRLSIYNKDFKAERLKEIEAESLRLEAEANKIMEEEELSCQK